MSGLAHIFLDLGFRVTGSDLAENEEIRELKSRGAMIQIGHHRSWLMDCSPKLVVYSSAIRTDNVERAAAREAGIPCVRRGVCLAALLQRQSGVCVAGMHGKTTTSALLAFALEQLGENPSYAIGALVPQLKPHARFVTGRPADPSPSSRKTAFVVEADESDGTLREFFPEHAIVLNIDAEHLDYFAGIESVCAEFEEFGRNTHGRLVYCADDPQLVRLFSIRPGAISYGVGPNADYRAERVAPVAGGKERGDRIQEFAVFFGGKRLGEFRTCLPGEQNVSNATAVVALLHQLGFDSGEVARVLERFHGALRRQQVLYQDDRFQVIEDYGHHPTEIRATLRALRQWAPKRLLVAFQPHRFSRTKLLLDEFAGCFAEADRLWLTDVYAASESPSAGVNGKALAEAVHARVGTLAYVPDIRALPKAIEKVVVPGDLVLFLGAGDITKAAHEFARDMQNEWTNTQEALLRRLTARLSPDSIVKRNEPLAGRTTLRVGGSADFYAEPASESDLSAVLNFCAEFDLPVLVLGRGSNLLVRDKGVRGVVIGLGRPAFTQIRVENDRLICGAGAKLRTVAVEAKRHGIAGLEFLEGIPGTVGGALRMNAGAMGGAMFDRVESARFMDREGQARECPASELPVKYRSCSFFKHHIALGAVLRGRLGPAEEIAEKMSAWSQKRRTSQPAAPSAGCIFKNPITIPAGKLIDELGLKGMRVGGAMVSEVHGNFIVNDGGATARDVLELIELIQRRAKEARGIDLETEVEIVGEL